MKYFITGYKGQLGYDLVRELAKRGELDITVSDLGELGENNQASIDLMNATNLDGNWQTAISGKKLDLTDGRSVSFDSELGMDKIIGVLTSISDLDIGHKLIPLLLRQERDLAVYV